MTMEKFERRKMIENTLIGVNMRNHKTVDS